MKRIVTPGLGATLRARTKRIKSVLGVTLLEILLVLAIASMIIVMSIRYYQAANTSQQATATINQIFAISAAMDSLSITKGTYSSITNTDSAVLNYLGSSGGMTSVAGTQFKIAPSTSTYVVTVTLGAKLCQSVLAQISSNPKFTGATCDPSTGLLTYTYNKALG
jgi:type II secretory pathway pseudopilin PulG